MHSTSERTSAILKRTAEIKYHNKVRNELIRSGFAILACIILVFSVALTMPVGLTGQDINSESFSGAAAVFASSGASGYVLMGLLGFVLGCAVTILCFRMRRRSEADSYDRDN